MTLLASRQERTRFLKFMAVGVIGAVVDFGVMNLLTRLAAMPLVPAGTISFVCAVISNFTWNRYWTYPDSRSRPIWRQLAMFFIVNAAGVAIRVPILWVLEPPLLRFFQGLSPRQPATPDFLAKNFTLACAVGVVMLWNFFVNRYWTYNDIHIEDLAPNMDDNRRPIIPIYTSRGDAEAFLVYPHIFNLQGEWIGFATPQGEVYSVLGHYVGYINQDPRLLRKRVTETTRPRLAPPTRPRKVNAPATFPLAPLMGEPYRGRGRVAPGPRLNCPTLPPPNPCAPRASPLPS
jgi:putative flippase GtrA